MGIKLGEALSELEHWFEINGLKLNQNKTQLVKFCTPQSRDLFNGTLEFEGQTLKISKNTKFLGLYVDLHFSWGKCIETVISKLNSACFQMLCLRNTTDLKTRIMIYYAYFYSILQYGIEFWGFASGVERILKVQKKFLRIMTFTPWKSSCKPIYRELKIMTVPNLTIFKTLLMVQSMYESLYSENFDHVYNTRFKNNFQYPRHRLKLVEKTPTYIGKKLFNKLPVRYKDLINSRSFKSSLADFLIRNTYYSVNEYLSDNQPLFDTIVQ